MKSIHRTAPTAVIAAALLLLAVPALGQGRNAFQVGTMNSPGSIGNYGSANFRAYSYGLGGGGGGSGTGSGGNSFSGGSYAIGRSGGGGGGRVGGDIGAASYQAPRPVSRMVYRRSGHVFNNTSAAASGGRGYTSLLRSTNTISGVRLRSGELAAGAALVDHLYPDEAPLYAPADGPVTSLAPVGPGMYGELMRKGEEAFREARYEEALNQFRRANYIAREAPENLLSLANTYMALGMYNSMANSVRKAVTARPEILEANVALPSLFRDRDEFDQLHQALQERAETMRDAGIWLSLAYVEQFSGDLPAADDALRQAGRYSAAGSEFRAAIESFWSAAVEAGRVEGELAVGAPYDASTLPDLPTQAPSLRSLFGGPDR